MLIQNNFPFVLDYKIAIVGMGLSGQAALRLLLSLQISPERICLFDEKTNATENLIPLLNPFIDQKNLNQLKKYSNPEQVLLDFQPDVLIVSPGVSLQKPWIQKFKEDPCHKVSSELELAFHYLQTEKVICVTGSLGKSTTTSLLGVGAQAFDSYSFFGGNLGKPLADYITEIISLKRPRASWLILELSSYQLENFNNLRSDLSIFTFFTPNHLERYPDLEIYYETKWSLVKKTKGPCLINLNGGDLTSYAENKLSKEPIVSDQTSKPLLIWTSRSDTRLKSFDLENMSMVGSHNSDNLALAAHVALYFQWPLEAISSMKQFKGLPHRLENLGFFQNIHFINDSKATTMESVKQAALSILDEKKGTSLVFLLIGGKDKNLPWEELTSLKSYPMLSFVFFGQCGELAQAKTQLTGPIFKTLKECLMYLKTILKEGNTVLLSPGGTSLDEFKSFEDRGLFFKNEILKHWPNFHQQESPG